MALRLSWQRIKRDDYRFVLAQIADRWAWEWWPGAETAISGGVGRGLFDESRFHKCQGLLCLSLSYPFLSSPALLLLIANSPLLLSILLVRPML